MLDMHCHILPSVDDGAKDESMALAMLKAAARVGIDTIVATPHVRRGFQDPQLIADRMAFLRPHAASLNINLLLGYELNCRILAREGVGCAKYHLIENSPWLLLEFNDTLPPQWEYLLGDLTGMGIRVIIAHPERYSSIQARPELALEMTRLGCVLQVDAKSTLPLGGLEKRVVKWLSHNETPFILASDAHKPEDYAAFAKAVKKYKNAPDSAFLAPYNIRPRA